MQKHNCVAKRFIEVMFCGLDNSSLGAVTFGGLGPQTLLVLAPGLKTDVFLQYFPCYCKLSVQ